MAQYTPMIQQYLDIKRSYQDAFLFFRLGDFYELFFDDAIKASRELEITLTGREGGGEQRIPMCGVPHHSADTYIAELVKRGYKVAICEQVEDPKEAKGVVRREVTRIITPGTMMEGKWLSDKENNYLVAVASSNGYEGVAACDMSTGEMYVTSFLSGSKAVWEEAMHYRPSELLVLGDLPADKSFSVAVTHLAETDLLPEITEEQYGKQTESLLPAMKRAIGCLLSYIGTTQKRSLAHMRTLHAYQADQFLMMDSFSKRNLELTETIRDKSKRGSLLWLLDRTETAMGGRLLRRWIERPLLDMAEITYRHNAVDAFKGDMLLRSDVRGLLDDVYDLERLAGRVAYGNANARDLVQLRHSLLAIPNLKTLLMHSGASVLAELAEGLDECGDVSDFLGDALVDDPPLSVREGGLIRTGYDEYLDKLHLASREGKTWIAQLEQSEREATGIRSLKVGFNKVFGYYIEISRANLSNVPEGRYERKQTLANAERFITAELKEKEALILEAEEKMVELEYQLFTQIRTEVAKHIPRIQALAERVAAIDVLQAFATVSEERRFVRPTIDSTGEIRITEGRHPVVEAVLDNEKYVSNDVWLNQKERNILLITGPNMAGKSTYMRQIALIVIMAQIGCFVPAKEATVSLVDQIFTRIGAADDLVGGYSTFMVEMLETKNALTKATPRSLILLDEIGRGTSTYDGMALAQAVIEYIDSEIGAKTLFSTHYHELTGLQETISGLVNVNARCAERDGRLLFLHKIEEGRADKSYGIHVAQLADMPQQVISRAQQILQGLEAGQRQQESKQMTLEDLWSASSQESQTRQIQQTPQEANEPSVDSALQKLAEELEKLDIHQLTPLQALITLSEWKDKWLKQKA